MTRCAQWHGDTCESHNVDHTIRCMSVLPARDSSCQLGTHLAAPPSLCHEHCGGQQVVVGAVDASPAGREGSDRERSWRIAREVEKLRHRDTEKVIDEVEQLRHTARGYPCTQCERVMCIVQHTRHCATHTASAGFAHCASARH